MSERLYRSVENTCYIIDLSSARIYNQQYVFTHKPLLQIMNKEDNDGNHSSIKRETSNKLL